MTVSQNNPSNQKMREFLHHREVLSQQVALYRNQLEILNFRLIDCAASKKCLEELITRKDGESVLISLGGQIFLKVKLSTPPKLSYKIGSGISVDLNPEKAIAKLDDLMDETRKVVSQFQKEFREINSSLQRLEFEIQKLSSSK